MFLKTRHVFAILLFTASVLFSQQKAEKYWIYFRDKDERVLHTLSRSANAKEISHATGIGERSLSRRAKVLPREQLVSSEDLPVSQSYIGQLQRAGISVINTSRWFNAVTAMLTIEQRARVANCSFVDRVEPVRTYRRRELPQAQIPVLEKSSAPSIQQIHDYGLSSTQVSQINVVNVHNLRITGRGVLVGMLDSGFRWRVADATKNMNIVKEYDFIQHDTVTANESGKTPIDEGGQDGHGTITLSVVGGYKEGELVSPAFGASFILAKTEYIPTETNGEEDNWVAGIEWEEQNGADVVSSSLGYSDFDATDSLGNPQHSYTVAEMNGRTAKTSIAALMAARRGVVVCSAMGNEGNNPWHILTSPADADSIISVGAVNSSGALASFSSVGPTSDGRTKPDVVAQGVSTYAATVSPTSYGFFGGTSLSTPLVAGAAALLLSAHPELTPIQVREALRSTASNASLPDNNIGWGIINTYKAILYYGMVLSTDPEITITPEGNMSVGVFVVSNAAVKRDSVLLHYSTDGGTTFAAPLSMTLTDIVDSSTNSGKYTAMIPNQVPGIAVQFYVSAVDATNKWLVSHVAATPPVPVTFALYQNFPNPFNSSTSIQYILDQANFTTLKIYDMLGREVATIVNEYQPPGVKLAGYFDASRFASGVYLYRLTSGEFSAVKKMVLLK